MKRYLYIILIISIEASCWRNEKRGTEKEVPIQSSDSFGKKVLVFKYRDFEIFYQRFITDTAFQISRVKFPIKGTYSDYGGNDNWKRKKWPYIKWDLREEIAQTSDSTSVIQDSSEFFFGNYCLDCGFSFEMKFEKSKGEWFMTYRQENNF